jgi:hypothetical protein
MLKISSHRIILAQSWMDEIRDVDWGDDVPGPHEVPGIVNEENLDNYLTDDIEDTKEWPIGQQPVPQEIDEIRDEIPKSNELLGIPEDTKEISYTSPQEMLYDAMDTAEVVSFEYTSRHGNYAGLRTVEPHYSFVAPTTGNEVVVTYDRDVNDIRAFIIGNIHPGGVRYENVIFNPRNEIMRGVA